MNESFNTKDECPIWLLKIKQNKNLFWSFLFCYLKKSDEKHIFLTSRESTKEKKAAESTRESGPNPIAPPPPDIQPIIDRMAMYVAKNGQEFEMVVKSRNDTRFQFLNENHAYFPYYSVMKDCYMRVGTHRIQAFSHLIFLVLLWFIFCLLRW